MNMPFLKDIPPFIFFTGKGGVGKTSLACATAVWLADQGKKTLLVSTDPASNVGQVFSQTIGHRITDISIVQNLAAMEVDPMAAAQAYRDRVLDPVRELMPADVVSSIEEQLSGSCTTEIAAFDEFTGLLTNHELREKYDHIVFDTAPTGHTIRMLELPGAWSGYLEANPDAAANLGPLVGLEKQQHQYSDAVKALSDAALTRLVLVARAQASTLKEVSHTHDELSAIGLQHQHLAINGVLPPFVGENDPLAQSILAREEQALLAMPENLANLPRSQLYLKPFNLVGLEALRKLFTESEASMSLPTTTLNTLDLPKLASLVDELSLTGKGLVMTMGKGGVGKTTVAASVAVSLAKRGHKVHLTTSDPAAHLSYTLDGSLPNLQVSRIDPKVETERYRRFVLENQGKGLDAEGLAVLEEDLRSPCTEEIAVFQAFSRVIKEADDHFVIMDTAPTGHTLLLLDATGAYHREMVRQMGQTHDHVMTPMMQLQDPEKTKVIIVTLAETTPVLEAANLQQDLRRAGIEPWAWVINSSLAAAKPSSPFLVTRASRELPLINDVTEQFAKRIALTPLQNEEPVGAALLAKMAS
ncbi:arsenical pump-driving ATPase [Salmonella enterica subsp. enterica serovar 4,[5],12:i:-]|uniref:Arsenical pump-driving ATPase n=14 Tax=Enterobacteriaceae TaxID=543 RepID=A0A5Y2E2F8_SALMU|nr:MULTISPECIES: arsenical pump-driving ATPase [Salmonella]EAB9433176.1 arsenical pump-driving ATPase [Salmonella enterica subsp. enterica serovar Typhimurium str. UK-1]EBC9891864.1 arsenical pump-driving ATPase [Salmonella enterica subsp. enterica serovar Agona]EBH0105952.1 arsenical pump-driving ATPase [Salmonella enterica subsp. enterica serovar 4:i:-]EBH8044608.1 arsenical pump-driving ATPase [Salmonella bongori]EBH9618672.1 arsenical pump-driving ATPase [Salmonella enterica subsp. enteric